MPLPTNLHGTISGGFEFTIDLLGVSAVWTQTKQPNDTKQVVVGWRTVSKDDTEVVAAYGFDSKIVTFKASDFPTHVPVKFDTLEVGGERYSLDEVLPIRLNDMLVGYKGYVRGK